jgi:hypothetical protein
MFVLKVHDIKVFRISDLGGNFGFGIWNFGLGAGYGMRDMGYGMRDTGCGMRDAGYGMRDTGCVCGMGLQVIKYESQ